MVRPTPAILRNRRLPTTDLFPRPKSGRFAVAIGPVPRSVVERSTWRPKCPVSLDQLSYLKTTFWGFDHKPHTGEMIVNASVAEQFVGVFRALYQARFPIEEMRVVTLKEQRAWHTAPTGDTNVTSSFECRQATLGSTWSEHAYGLAVDINPFHNPYLRGELVAPELARAYGNREWRRPGMIFEGDIATRAFDAIGWGWGGRWSSLKDWMHFSQSGH
ncbi:MAG: M15 family metallopeptidase [Actinomycetota bacterium]